MVAWRMDFFFLPAYDIQSYKQLFAVYSKDPRVILQFLVLATAMGRLSPRPATLVR